MGWDKLPIGFYDHLSQRRNKIAASDSSGQKNQGPETWQKPHMVTSKQVSRFFFHCFIQILPHFATIFVLFYSCLGARYIWYDKLIDQKPFVSFEFPHLVNHERQVSPAACRAFPKSNYYLVGGIPTPLKNMTSSVGMMTFPYILEKSNSCSKPPTSNGFQRTDQSPFSLVDPGAWWLQYGEQYLPILVQWHPLSHGNDSQWTGQHSQFQEVCQISIFLGLL